MKIVHICKWDKGGAYNAVFGLHDGLRQNGVDSKILRLEGTSSDINVVQFKQKRSGILKYISDKIRNALIYHEFNAYKNSRPRGLDMFSNARTVYEISEHPLVKEADIIHLHSPSPMIDYPEFFRNTINTPMVMTLHDMNFFTGGCHYSGGCVKYTTACGGCPQLGSKDPNDLSRRVFKIKEKAYRDHNIRVISTSNWMRDCAIKSPLFKNFKIETLHCDTPVNIFKKQDKIDARSLLKLPQDKIIILFGAAYYNERKGFKCLAQSLQLLKDKVHGQELMLVTFGEWQSALLDSLKNGVCSVRALGYIDSKNMLAHIYNAADIFVIPSLEEAFGQTCLEAMSCEIPVIGSNIGGIPDMIIPDKTGLLVKAGNAAELAQGIGWLISHPRERAKMTENGRRLVEEEYASPTQTTRYIKIYETIK